MRDDGRLAGGDLADCIARDPSLSEGQRRRLRVFQGVEEGVCSRVETLCGESPVEVSDVGVLVVSADALQLVFGADIDPSTHVVLGHRLQIHDLLHAVLPPEDGAPVDPYVDLLTAAPAQCVRVMILDTESLTVLSYGTFVTVRVNGKLPQA